MRSIFSKVSSAAKNAVYFQNKKKSEKLKNVKLIFSKVSIVAKNVIYLKRKKYTEKNKLDLLKDRHVEFSLGKYLIKTISPQNPLFERVLNLRYKIFFGHSCELCTDNDKFDNHCDHLIVIDTSVSNDFVVGTYRLLYKPKDIVDYKFYSESEFDICNITRNKCNLLEAGRSCVQENYRDGRIIRLLWRGITTYIKKNEVDLIFGCASFPSANYLEFTKQLNYLKKFHSPPKAFQAYPRIHRKANFNKQDIPFGKCKEIFRTLPPLIKAYIRAGSWISPGASVDKEFDTTDVLVVLKTKNIIKKYSDLEITE